MVRAPVSSYLQQNCSTFHCKLSDIGRFCILVGIQGPPPDSSLQLSLHLRVSSHLLSILSYIAYHLLTPFCLCQINTVSLCSATSIALGIAPNRTLDGDCFEEYNHRFKIQERIKFTIEMTSLT